MINCEKKSTTECEKNYGSLFCNDKGLIVCFVVVGGMLYNINATADESEFKLTENVVEAEEIAWGCLETIVNKEDYKMTNIDFYEDLAYYKIEYCYYMGE